MPIKGTRERKRTNPARRDTRAAGLENLGKQIKAWNMTTYLQFILIVGLIMKTTGGAIFIAVLGRGRGVCSTTWPSLHVTFILWLSVISPVTCVPHNLMDNIPQLMHFIRVPTLTLFQIVVVNYDSIWVRVYSDRLINALKVFAASLPASRGCSARTAHLRQQRR